MVKRTCVRSSALLSQERVAPRSYRATYSLHRLQVQSYFLGSLENQARFPQRPLCLPWKTLASENVFVTEAEKMKKA